MSFVEFSYRQQHSYKDYIAQQYLRENMDVVISKNIREAVGSIKDVYESGVKEIKSTLDDNFEQVTFNLEQISGSIDVLNSNLVTGFQMLFVKADDITKSLAHLSRGIDKLVEIAQTPVQTWAFNQYEIAGDMVRRQLYPEALEALTYAIEGKDQHTGYKSDFRFHCLRGVIRSGIPGEPESRDFIDLGVAEDSFLQAARYAKHDHPVMAAQALVSAGKASYAAGRLSDAKVHYKDALDLDSSCAEANYQMARVIAHNRDLIGMEGHLCRAFDAHWSFAMRAAADSVFTGDKEFSDLVKKCIETVTKKICGGIEPKLMVLRKGISFLEMSEFRSLPLSKIDGWQELRRTVDDIAAAMKSNQLKHVYELRSRFLDIVRDFVQRFIALIRAYVHQIESAKSSIIIAEASVLTESEKSERWANVKRGAIVTGCIGVALSLLPFLCGAPLGISVSILVMTAVMTPIFAFLYPDFGQIIWARRNAAVEERIQELSKEAKRFSAQDSALLGLPAPSG